MKDFAPRTPAARAVEPATGKGATLVDNRAGTVAQRKTQAAIAASPRQVAQRQPAPVQLAAPRPNRTGLPDKLKAGVESLSGHSLDDVKVHYNSAKPAQLQAHAYAQGTDIHLGPGQEKHLPHEAWHVVQQKQGRVRATAQMKGSKVNNNSRLEKEADVMGGRSLNAIDGTTRTVKARSLSTGVVSQLQIVQFGGKNEAADDDGYEQDEAVDDDGYERDEAAPLPTAAARRQPKRPRASAAASGQESDHNTAAALPTAAAGRKPKRWKGRGTILRDGESGSSSDSDGHYHMDNSAAHDELLKRLKKGATRRDEDTQNLVSAQLTVFFRQGEKYQSESRLLDSIWNSGAEQHSLGAEKVNFEKELHQLINKLLPGKTFNSQMHSHSETAMAADPEIMSKFTKQYQLILNGIEYNPDTTVITKAVIQVHSSPHTVCPYACRPALEDVRQRLENILKNTPIKSRQPPVKNNKVESIAASASAATKDKPNDSTTAPREEDIRLSNKFNVDLVVSSVSKFSGGTKEHNAFEKGEFKKLEEAAVTEGGHLYEALHRTGQNKKSKK